MTNTQILQNYGDLLKSLNIKIEIPKIKLDYKIKLSDKIKEYLIDKHLINNVENVIVFVVCVKPNLITFQKFFQC